MRDSIFILEAIEALERNIDEFRMSDSSIQRIRKKTGTRGSHENCFPKRVTRCSNCSLGWEIIARFGCPRIERKTFPHSNFIRK